MSMLSNVLNPPTFTPAFLHRRTRAIIKSPGFHDYYVLPEAAEGLYDDDDELLPWTRLYVDGFVDVTGKFYTRKEAADAVKHLLPGVGKRGKLTTEDLGALRGVRLDIPDEGYHTLTFKNDEFTARLHSGGVRAKRLLVHSLKLKKVGDKPDAVAFIGYGAREFEVLNQMTSAEDWRRLLRGELWFAFYGREVAMKRVAVQLNRAAQEQLSVWLDEMQLTAPSALGGSFGGLLSGGFSMEDLFGPQDDAPAATPGDLFRNSAKGYEFTAGGRRWRVTRSDVGLHQRLVIEAEKRDDDGSRYAEWADGVLTISPLAKRGEFRPVGKPLVKVKLP